MLRRSFALLTAFILVLVLGHVPQADAASATDNGLYKIINRNSGQAMEVYNWAHENGANVSQWSDLGGDNQLWRFVSVGSGYYQIINANSGRALEVYQYSTADGANIVQWQNINGYNQHWKLEDSGGYVQLKNRHSGKVAEVYAHSTATGANISQWTDLDNPNQQWTLVKVSPSSTTVNSTIVVKAGEVYDGKGRTFIAGSSLGDGGQSEGQKPVFKLENGATLKNVVLGAPAADGIHTYGDVYLSNIVWTDIGEDALTIKESGTVTLNGGAAYNGADKMFQINAPSTFRVYNFVGRDAGKFIRQVGGSTFTVNVFIDSCDIAGMNEAIFRTDSSTSTVTMTNTLYSDVGDKWIGVKHITELNNTAY
ncbi:pectate lyase [Paenibacillus tepidiphilus]|uniref:pectate lyase n=1 Tax=Paenibacillus tepidiphilus TaxID=2608683 RepID=UPI0012387D6D|nr:pectate lyase [Paenibacillus tepidiphilus]